MKWAHCRIIGLLAVATKNGATPMAIMSSALSAALLLFFLLSPTTVFVHSQKILTSLREYDDLRNNSTAPIDRVGNVDVISDSNGSTIGLCNLAMMMPFSFYPGPPPE